MPFDLGIRKLDPLSNDPAFATIWLDAGDHYAFQFDLKVRDGLAVAVCPHELKAGFRDSLPVAQVCRRTGEAKSASLLKLIG